MKEFICTECGSKESRRWKLIKDEVLCGNCHVPTARTRVSARTDIELSSVSMGDSVAMFKRKKEERRIKRLREKMLKKSELNRKTLNYR